MRILILFLACSLIFASCRSKDKLPSGILSQKEMQSVLFDMLRADQFLTDFVFSRDPTMKQDSASTSLYAKVMAIHGITREEFKRSFDYYNAHPALLKVIMDSISASNPLQNAIKVAPEIKTAKPDSNPVTRSPREILDSIRKGSKKGLKVE